MQIAVSATEIQRVQAFCGRACTMSGITQAPTPQEINSTFAHSGIPLALSHIGVAKASEIAPVATARNNNARSRVGFERQVIWAVSCGRARGLDSPIVDLRTKEC